MKTLAGRELVFQMLVSLFVAVACFAAALVVLHWEGTRAAVVGIGTFIVSLFLFGILISARTPGEKNRVD